jgi:hypothetical protein
LKRKYLRHFVAFSLANRKRSLKVHLSSVRFQQIVIAGHNAEDAPVATRKLSLENEDKAPWVSHLCLLWPSLAKRLVILGSSITCEWLHALKKDSRCIAVAVHFSPTNYCNDSCVAQNNQGGELRNAIARVAFFFSFWHNRSDQLPDLV